MLNTSKRLIELSHRNRGTIIIYGSTRRQALRRASSSSSFMGKLKGCPLVFFFFFFFVFLFCVVVRGSHGSREKVAFFIFGDSLLDAGNNNYINTSTLDQANFWPYGLTYFKFPTGRFSDGRLISDFIAEYANLPLIRPYLEPGNTEYYDGVNFASSGAGALLQTFQGYVIPLETQAKYFKKVAKSLRHKLGKAKTKRVLSNAVYLFSIGNNDYLSPFLTSSDFLNSYSHSQYINMVIGNFTTVVKGIYESGGRKFGFINLPPLGCLPGTRILNSNGNGISCFKELTVLANLHNQALSLALLQLEKKLKGFKYSLYDFHAEVTQRINHPSKYGVENEGLKEGKAACCGSGPFRGESSCGGRRGQKHFELCDNPNLYLFWDSYHLTETAYRQFASQMWGHTPNSFTVRPYTMRDLFQVL